MPQTASVHIQARDTDPIRVVMLSGHSARIGRAAFCDVRLVEPGLADEVCRLRFRGGAWQIAPVGTNPCVWLDGELLDQARAMPFELPFRIGESWLTLRSHEDATPSVERWTPPREAWMPAHSTSMAVEPLSVSVPAGLPETAMSQRHHSGWDLHATEQDRLVQNHREVKRWESRMKAVGEKLRTGASTLTAPAMPTIPVSEFRRTTLRRDSVSKRPETTAPKAPRIPRPDRQTVARPSWRDLPESRTAETVHVASESRTVLEPEPLRVAQIALPQPHVETFAESDAFALEVESISASLDWGTTELLPNSPLEPLESAVPSDHAFLEGSVSDSLTWSAGFADAPPTGFSEPIQALEVSETEDHLPPRSQRLGSAKQVPVEPLEIDEPEAPRSIEVEPEGNSESSEWAGAESFITRTYLGGHDNLVDSSSPIVHETSTIRDHAPHSGFTSEGIHPSGPYREWPSVTDILAAQGVRVRPTKTHAHERKTSPCPLPTPLEAPEAWSLPLWLGWTPLAASALVIAAAGLFASWTWARDEYNAGIILSRLADLSSRREPLPEGVAQSAGAWWRTDAPNLLAWAAYVVEKDPDESRALLDRAGQVSPLNPTVRHMRASAPRQGETKVPLARVLGQSRDVLTMAAAGRRLLEEGKKTEALETYRLALAMAAHPDPARAQAPHFLDDPEAGRYSLPGEEVLGPIVREMALSKGWTYNDWVSVLPEQTIARVVAARVLREQGSEFAPAALDAALAEPEPNEGNSPAIAAVRLAAGAEALALQGKWADARERYRQAINLSPVDVVRRAWWLNVAALSLRLNEETERQKALEAAKNPDPRDEVTQRVVEIQKKMGYVAQRTTARSASPREGNPPGSAQK